MVISLFVDYFVLVLIVLHLKLIKNSNMPASAVARQARPAAIICEQFSSCFKFTLTQYD